jgi:hypothetical protein
MDPFRSSSSDSNVARKYLTALTAIKVIGTAIMRQQVHHQHDEQHGLPGAEVVVLGDRDDHRGHDGATQPVAAHDRRPITAPAATYRAVGLPVAWR